MKSTEAIEMSINSAKAEIDVIIERINKACSESRNVITFERLSGSESLSAGARMYFEYNGFQVKYHNATSYDWSIKWDLDFLLSLNKKNSPEQSVGSTGSPSSIQLGNYAGAGAGSDGPGFLAGVVLGGILF